MKALNHPILGYEVLTSDECGDSCSVCLRLADEAAESAWDAGASRALNMLYLTNDDNTVIHHEVTVVRLFAVDRSTEPF
jgi:hypothetical protein